MSSHKSILVTGANGFVGRRLVESLSADPTTTVYAASRRPLDTVLRNVTHVQLGDLASDELAERLFGIDVVVHLAARVHVMNETYADALAKFRHANVAATALLAESAAAAGVRRFVFVSSVKVNGEETPRDGAFRSTDAPCPHDPYGVSKLEAERELQRITGAFGMELAIVRPVLVYGPGVGANFARMMRWLCRGVPLPFGSIDNLRSLIALDNLCDLLVTCAWHPAADGQTFLASDQEDISTPDLLRRLGIALGRPTRLFNIPQDALRWAFRWGGQAEAGRRLCSSLRVDANPARQILSWRPPVSLDAALLRTAQHFLGVGQKAAPRRGDNRC